MIKINMKMAERYARAQCTDERIAAVCNVSETSLKRIIGPKLHQWRLAGQAQLQLAQWERGLKTKDVQMLKHLGKHYLGQHDQVQLTTSSEPEVRRLLSHWGAGTVDTVRPMVSQHSIESGEQQSSLVALEKANLDDENE